MPTRNRDQWEEQLRDWSKPPGQTEATRMANAEQLVKNAINRSAKLKTRSIRVFVQGSYRNNTNIPGESDVDVAILCTDVFYPNYPPGTTKETFGNRDADYKYIVFKNEVGEALVDYLGPAAVSRGNKAFDIKETTYHVEADAAPFFERRRYSTNGTYIAGVELLPDDGKPPSVINYPDQHYENGVAKNNRTGRRYKSLVRILKNLRQEMADAKIPEAEAIPRGFLLECLVWNVPDEKMGSTTLYEDLKASLAFLYVATSTEAGCSEWGEVSELKYLFRPSQKWTREQVNAFVLRAWTYVGY